ncbi:MAG TPA: hypothetical protein VLS89_02825 [Candidatus Nanopelagicales bacterium]|nr:hypothetical protein [Candidatus Nanopelagicales bacterium]
MTDPKQAQPELAASAAPVRKALPTIPTPTVEQIRLMRISGRTLGDEIAEEFESILTVTEEDLQMRLE